MSPPAAGITSEADAILHMDQLRAMGFRGGGIRVGVISTGVVNLAAYQAAGLLPGGAGLRDHAVFPERHDGEPTVLRQIGSGAVDRRRGRPIGKCGF